jgi:hypothetical protein
MILLWIFIWFLCLWIVYFAFFQTKKKLSKQEQWEIQKLFRTIIHIKNSKEKIIESDKLYHKMLMLSGYTGTFWEILKQNPNIIQNINKIWELHKLRNTLSHEFDEIEEKILSKKSKEYTKEIENLLQNIS